MSIQPMPFAIAPRALALPVVAWRRARWARCRLR